MYCTSGPVGELNNDKTDNAKTMLMTNTLIGEHIYEVMLKSVQNCTRSLCKKHFLPMFAESKCHNSRMTKLGQSKGMPCTSTLDGNHVYEVSLKPLIKCPVCSKQMLGPFLQTQ